MSAACGREFLKAAASSLSFTGSYWMSAVPFAAAIANINKLKKIDAPKLLREKSVKLLDGLKSAADNNGFDLVVSGEPSLFYLRIANDDSMMIHQDWVAEMVKRGIFISSHHNHFMNAAVSDEDIKRTVDIANEAFRVTKKMHPEAF